VNKKWHYPIVLSVAASVLLAAPASADRIPDRNAASGFQAVEKLGLLSATAQNGPAELHTDGTTTLGGSNIIPEVNAARTERRPGLTVIRDAQPYADTVVQALEDGVRYLTVIKGRKASTESRYRFVDSELTARADGSVTIRRNDGSTQSIAPAWAVDARGATVPTRYSVSGDTLIQRVDHRGFAYPVVADPRVSTCLIDGWRPSICYKYNRDEVVAAKGRLAGLAGAAAAIGFMCSLIPNSPAASAAVKLVCVTLLATQTANLVNGINDAYSSNRCLEIRFPIPTPGFYRIRVINC